MTEPSDISNFVFRLKTPQSVPCSRFRRNEVGCKSKANPWCKWRKGNKEKRLSPTCVTRFGRATKPISTAAVASLPVAERSKLIASYYVPPETAEDRGRYQRINFSPENQLEAWLAKRTGSLGELAAIIASPRSGASAGAKSGAASGRGAASPRASRGMPAPAPAPVPAPAPFSLTPAAAAASSSSPGPSSSSGKSKRKNPSGRTARSRDDEENGDWYANRDGTMHTYDKCMDYSDDDVADFVGNELQDLDIPIPDGLLDDKDASCRTLRMSSVLGAPDMVEAKREMDLYMKTSTNPQLRKVWESVLKAYTEKNVDDSKRAPKSSSSSSSGLSSGLSLGGGGGGGGGASTGSGSRKRPLGAEEGGSEAGDRGSKRLSQRATSPRSSLTGGAGAGAGTGTGISPAAAAAAAISNYPPTVIRRGSGTNAAMIATAQALQAAQAAQALADEEDAEEDARAAEIRDAEEAAQYERDEARDAAARAGDAARAAEAGDASGGEGDGEGDVSGGEEEEPASPSPDSPSSPASPDSPSTPATEPPASAYDQYGNARPFLYHAPRSRRHRPYSVAHLKRKIARLSGSRRGGGGGW
jgi:hypothetical protein